MKVPRGKRHKKPQPIFAVGELLPWKGVWFRLVHINPDTKMVTLAPQTDAIMKVENPA